MKGFSNKNTRMTLKSDSELQKILQDLGVKNADKLKYTRDLVEILNFHSKNPEDKEGLNQLVESKLN